MKQPTILFPRNSSRRQRAALAECCFRLQRRDHQLRRRVPFRVALPFILVAGWLAGAGVVRWAFWMNS